eukprot:TRINITY_DN13322_c0_g2_i1.p1 TRINITY_DN13322_c0_g2~~TRINITY_DN13322_c0_g2_i1.p1  ORF type:complete len:202 (-),score=89.21 TRINITY_DN13322_c0_g2_i1:141-677(-)
MGSLDRSELENTEHTMSEKISTGGDLGIDKNATTILNGTAEHHEENNGSNGEQGKEEQKNENNVKLSMEETCNGKNNGGSIRTELVTDSIQDTSKDVKGYNKKTEEQSNKNDDQDKDTVILNKKNEEEENNKCVKYENKEEGTGKKSRYRKMIVLELIKNKIEKNGLLEEDKKIKKWQ